MVSNLRYANDEMKEIKEGEKFLSLCGVSGCFCWKNFQLNFKSYVCCLLIYA